MFCASGNRNNIKHMEFTGWRYPLTGWVKIDVDDYSKENPGIAGAGGVIRDDMRIWIVGFTLNIGICISMCRTVGNY
jgi:hypothetical protein